MGKIPNFILGFFFFNIHVLVFSTLLNGTILGIIMIYEAMQIFSLQSLYWFNDFDGSPLVSITTTLNTL